MQVIMQAQAAECGLACLAMVATAHGHRVDLAELRQRFPVSRKGSNLEQLNQQAAAMGLAARALRLELDELGQLKTPCILHWDLEHFVVLHRVHRNGISVLDPAVGARRLRWAQVSRHFTGVAVEFQPNADFKPRRKPTGFSLRQLTGRVQGLGRALATVGVVALALECFAIVAPLVNQVVVDEAVASNDLDLLGVLILGFGLLLLIQTLLGVSRSWMVTVLSQSLALQWKGNVFGHLVRLPPEWFERRHLGDITSRFGSVGAIQQTLTTALVEAVLDGLMVGAALVMMLLYSRTLSAVVLAAVVLYALLRWASYRPMREAASERLVLAARENTHFLETLRAITPLKLLGREQERRARWQNLVVEVQNRDLRTARIGLWVSAGNGLIFGVENLIVLWLAAGLIMRGSGMPAAAGVEVFTVGMLFAFMSYKGQFTSRISALIDYGIQISLLGMHTQRLADIALAPPEADLAATGLPEVDLQHLPASLELRNVSYRYGAGEPWVLRDVNLKIDAGEAVALVGPSGAGKTTLVKLVLGLLVPTEGEVLFGGVPLRQLGLPNVRRVIGTVMQEDVLLSGSLLDNIAGFAPQPDEALVQASARMARVHDEILRMPMGYRTLVGDLGHGLSGGQKQRVLLARALYRKPRVLALDEATSHLDPASEAAIAQALRALPVTRLLITHRGEVARTVARVVAVRDGNVGELGASRMDTAVAPVAQALAQARA